jgi:D-arabinose 1-dehydrogenase-like Zn-dependent alcohol dehydrogenase
VFEALFAAETKPTDRVGIYGLGGLGSMAVLFARAMGSEVVVFSSRESKRADAMALGATDFCVLPDRVKEGKRFQTRLMFCYLSVAASRTLSRNTSQPSSATRKFTYAAA